jgi:D-xylose transport system permease protein
VRTIVFVLASTLAAGGGILAASRSFAVNQSSGSGDLLLLRSRPGHRGREPVRRPRDGVGGAARRARDLSIANGLDLLGLESDVKFLITGGAVMAAVSLDAITRQQRMAHARR